MISVTNLSATEIVLILLGLVVFKICLLISIGLFAARKSRSEAFPEGGRWRLEGRTESSGSHGPTCDRNERDATGGARTVTSSVVESLRRFAERDLSTIELDRTKSAVAVISESGEVVRYGTPASRIERNLGGGIRVQAHADRQDEALCLTLNAPGEARLEEKYSLDPVSGSLEVEVRFSCSGYDLKFVSRRSYERI
jgi:hypothetical protein